MTWDGTRAPVWHTVGAGGEPAFANGWVAYTETVQFRIDGNVVRLRGTVRNGSSYTTAAFVLPAGYRPDQDLRLLTWGGAAYQYTAGIFIQTTGAVNIYDGQALSGEHSLDGINFIAGA